MQTYLAELLGTMILVLLGDGVVANVVLDRTKGQNAGWIVITTGWGIAVAMAVYAVGRISGAHLNPGRHDRAGDDRQLPVGAGARLHRGADDRRLRRRRRSSGSPTCRTGATRPIPAAKLGVFCDRPGDPPHRRQPDLRDHRHRRAAVRHPRDRGQRADAVASPATSICRSSSAAACSRCSSACSCSASACRSAARPATRSTRRAISARASRTRSCRSPARARRTGATAGFRSSRPIIGGIAGAGPLLHRRILRTLMARYVGAVDQGTTSTRFMVFDRGGQRDRPAPARAPADPAAARLGRARSARDRGAHRRDDRARHAQRQHPRGGSRRDRRHQPARDDDRLEPEDRPALVQRHRLAGHAHRSHHQRAHARHRRRRSAPAPACRRRPISRARRSSGSSTTCPACARRRHAARRCSAIPTPGSSGTSPAAGRRRPRDRRHQREPDDADGSARRCEWDDELLRDLQHPARRCCRRSSPSSRSRRRSA